jgi:hypothetical protein
LPFGSRAVTVWLIQQGQVDNRKRVQLLMRLMGQDVTDLKPRLSLTRRGHRISTT